MSWPQNYYSWQNAANNYTWQTGSWYPGGGHVVPQVAHEKNNNYIVNKVEKQARKAKGGLTDLKVSGAPKHHSECSPYPKNSKLDPLTSLYTGQSDYSFARDIYGKQSETTGHLIIPPGSIPAYGTDAIMTGYASYAQPGRLELAVLSSVSTAATGVHKVPATWCGYILDHGPKFQTKNGILDGPVSLKGPVAVNGMLTMHPDSGKRDGSEDQQQKESTEWTYEVIQKAHKVLFD